MIKTAREKEEKKKEREKAGEIVASGISSWWNLKFDIWWLESLSLRRRKSLINVYDLKIFIGRKSFKF